MEMVVMAVVVTAVACTVVETIMVGCGDYDNGGVQNEFSSLKKIRPL